MITIFYDIIKLCLLLISEWTDVGSEALLIQGGENAVILNGSGCVIRCPSNGNPLAWYRTPPLSQKALMIYNGEEFDNTHLASIYTVNKMSGHTDLILHSAQLAYSGRYKCEEAGTLYVIESELVVIGRQTLHFFGKSALHILPIVITPVSCCLCVC